MNTITTGTYRAHRNTQCIHCGHIGFSSEFPDEPARHPSVCCHCRAAGRTMPASTGTAAGRNSETVSDLGALEKFSNVVGDKCETVSRSTPEPVTWGGHVVSAPGFTVDQFARAMVRAFADDLHIKALSGHGQYLVHHPGLTHGYRVTRERCDCPAGQVGTPCKHRAILIAHLDIRAPHVDREWRKLEAERPIAQPVEVA